MQGDREASGIQPGCERQPGYPAANNAYVFHAVTVLLHL
jgi:hypothetical protein